MPLRRLTTVNPDVRIGRSLPIGKLLVTCQIDAEETVSMFWCRQVFIEVRNFGWVWQESCVLSGKCPRGVVVSHGDQPWCPFDDSVVTASLFGWVGSMEIMKSFLLYG